MIAPRIRRAAVEEAEALTALTHRAKAAWGYDETFMTEARQSLKIEPAAIAEGLVWVAEGQRRRPIGVAALKRTGDPAVIELDALFVEPDVQRSGAGEALMARMSEIARSLGAKTLTIEADPNAAAFYERQGARRTGETPTGISGRALPVYEVKL
jgi:N-acetylglutamate synthase-like GNAT family acetyltransferase